MFDYFKKLCPLVIVLWLIPNFVFSCAILSIEQYSWSLHPVEPIHKYVSGNLGMFLPSYARIYLVLAYRYLIQKPLSQEEIKVASNLINARLDSSYIDTTKISQAIIKPWLDLRSTVGGFNKAKLPDFDTIASLENDYYAQICNIQQPAINQACNTLKELIQKYGITNAQVKDWITAQDIVFSNTANPKKAKIPSPLNNCTDNFLIDARNYQIACANFYAGNYDIATRQFDQLAQSPTYSALAKYLAVRSLIREGTIKTTKQFNPDILQKAHIQISNLLNDKLMQAYYNDLQLLENYIMDRLNPKLRLKEIANQILQKITSANLDEYTRVYDFFIGYNDSDFYNDSTVLNAKPLIKGLDELSDWIQAFQSQNPEAIAYTQSKWQDCQKNMHHCEPHRDAVTVNCSHNWQESSSNTLWYLACLKQTKPTDPLCPELIESFSSFKPQSKAYLTIAYYICQDFMSQKKYAQASTLLDKLLSQPNLDLSAQNLLLANRIQLAKSLPEFMKFALSDYVGIWGGGYDEVSYETEPVKSTKTKFIPLALGYINYTFPLELLIAIDDMKGLNILTRQALAKVIFVRAQLLGKTNDALNRAKLLSTLDKANQNLYQKFLKAKTKSQRDFIASFLMLKNDDFNPVLSNFSSTLAGYGFWWSSYDLQSLHMPNFKSENDNIANPNKIDYPSLIIPPLFLSKAQIASGIKENQELTKANAASVYLPNIVINYAKTNPKDPYVPQALHLAVRCTHLGDRSKDSSALSKKAFQLLYREFPQNIWTKKTPYYY